MMRGTITFLTQLVEVKVSLICFVCIRMYNTQFDLKLIVSFIQFLLY